jgi:tellurite resistance-related uncharacterized protein
VLLPEWEVVPSTTMKRAMSRAGMFKHICLLEGKISKIKMNSSVELALKPLSYLGLP